MEVIGQLQALAALCPARCSLHSPKRRLGWLKSRSGFFERRNISFSYDNKHDFSVVRQVTESLYQLSFSGFCLFILTYLLLESEDTVH